MIEPSKIVLFGPESTGKTTLCKELAKYFLVDWKPEYARLYLENKLNSNILTDAICPEEDLMPIVLGQIELENTIENNNKFVFLDTNPLETLVYAKYYFNKTYPWLEKIVGFRKYDYYLLTDISVVWQPDILRDKPNNRQEIFDLFLNELIIRKLDFDIITGLNENRLNNAIQFIKNKFL